MTYRDLTARRIGCCRNPVPRVRIPPIGAGRDRGIHPGPETADAPASCFASLTAAAFPLSAELAGNLTTRLQRQLLLPAPDITHDYASSTDIPVPVLLAQVLHSGVAANP